MNVGVHTRIHQAISEATPVIDVDGSYLHRKYQRLTEAGVHVARLDLPSPSLTGWEQVTEGNVTSLSLDVPRTTSGE